MSSPSRSILVVGSGPSGVHFAQSALDRGLSVTMLDVGYSGGDYLKPDATFSELRGSLPDPTRYFLGEQMEGLTLPTSEKEFYGFPPGKEHVFRIPGGFGFESEGFEPLFSFAQGGLAETWTAGCYPFNQQELSRFPFGLEELEPHYSAVAARIGVTGERDDLARFMPVHEHLLDPLRLDAHSEQLLRAYSRSRTKINRRYRAYVGRTRVATLSSQQGGRDACGYLGRCLWGCPTGALYTPSQTLKSLLKREGFSYLPGREVLSFQVSPSGCVESVAARNLASGETEQYPAERIALAAGALASAAIFLRSVRDATGENVRLDGLMDNRQALVPFLNLRMLGRTVPERSYQYHLIGMGLEGDSPEEYVHCQMTTLKTALMHPIAQSLPFDLRTSAAVVRHTRSALGVVNVNFHDTRRSDCHVTLSQQGEGADARLSIHYAPPADEPARVKGALARVRRVLLSLGCIVPPGMVHIRPMGASVHYAGLLPMASSGGPLTTTPGGESRMFRNVFLVDGITFPFLPAKNLTFTLMANASRIASALPV